MERRGEERERREGFPKPRLSSFFWSWGFFHDNCTGLALVDRGAGLRHGQKRNNGRSKLTGFSPISFLAVYLEVRCAVLGVGSRMAVEAVDDGFVVVRLVCESIPWLMADGCSFSEACLPPVPSLLDVCSLDTSWMNFFKFLTGEEMCTGMQCMLSQRKKTKQNINRMQSRNAFFLVA